MSICVCVACVTSYFICFSPIKVLHVKMPWLLSLCGENVRGDTFIGHGSSNGILLSDFAWNALNGNGVPLVESEGYPMAYM